MLNTPSVSIAPGQTRPVAFQLSLTPSSDEITLHFDILEDDGNIRSLMLQSKTTKRSIFEPHKYTFFHPSGVVSYAMIRPPSGKISNTSRPSRLPVLLNLHGAGLDAADPQLTHSLDDISDLPAWTVFPTGGTAWSADDWHQWGFADLEAAIAAIPSWIETVRWTGPHVDTQKWLVSYYY